MGRISRQVFSWLGIAFLAVSVQVSQSQATIGSCEIPDLLLAIRNCEADFVLALCRSPEQDCWNHSNITTVNACVRTELRNCLEGEVPIDSLDTMVETLLTSLGYNVTEEYCTGDKFEGPFFPSNGGEPPCNQTYPDVLTSCETDFMGKYRTSLSDPTLCREFGAMTRCKLSAVEQHCNLTDDHIKFLNVDWNINYNPFCLCPNTEPTTHAPTTPRQTPLPLGRCSVDDIIRRTQECESEFIYALCTNPDLDCVTHPDMTRIVNCTRDVYYDCVVGILSDSMVQNFLVTIATAFNAADRYCNGTTFHPEQMRTEGEGMECAEQYSNNSAVCIEDFMEYYLSNKSHPLLCREYASMTDCKKSALEDHCHSVHFDKLYELRLRLRSDYNPFCQCPNQYLGSTTTTTTITTTSKTSTASPSTVTAPPPSVIGTAATATESSTSATSTTQVVTSVAGTTNVIGIPVTPQTTASTPQIPTVTPFVATVTPDATTSEALIYFTVMTTVTSTPQTTTTAVTTRSVATTAPTSTDDTTHTSSTTAATTTLPSSPSTPLSISPTTMQKTTSTFSAATSSKTTSSTTHTSRATDTPTTDDMDTTTPTTTEMGTTMPNTTKVVFATTKMDTTVPTTVGTTRPTTTEMGTTMPTTTQMGTTMPTTTEMGTTTPTATGMGTTRPTTTEMGTTTRTITKMGTTTPATAEMGTTATTTTDMGTTMPTTAKIGTTTPVTTDMGTTTPATTDVGTTTSTGIGTTTSTTIGTTTPATTDMGTTVTTTTRMDSKTSTRTDMDTTTTTTTTTKDTPTPTTRRNVNTREKRTTTDQYSKSDRTTEPLQTAQEEQGPPAAVIAAAAGGVTVLGVAGIAAYVIKLKFCKPSRVYIA